MLNNTLALLVVLVTTIVLAFLLALVYPISMVIGYGLYTLGVIAAIAGLGYLTSYQLHMCDCEATPAVSELKEPAEPAS